MHGAPRPIDAGGKAVVDRIGSRHVHKAMIDGRGSQNPVTDRPQHDSSGGVSAQGAELRPNAAGWGCRFVPGQAPAMVLGMTRGGRSDTGLSTRAGCRRALTWAAG